eukprot:COSAG01_NODE_3307_length_6288_cov_62.023913_1_plen_75_part_00
MHDVYAVAAQPVTPAGHIMGPHATCAAGSQQPGSHGSAVSSSTVDDARSSRRSTPAGRLMQLQRTTVAKSSAVT